MSKDCWVHLRCDNIRQHHFNQCRDGTTGVEVCVELAVLCAKQHMAVHLLAEARVIEDVTARRALSLQCDDLEIGEFTQDA